MESAVSFETTAIIWESATFDAVSVRLTAQRHGIRTDASTRYEKSLDPLQASTTLSRVIDYMTFLGKEVSLTSSAHYIDEKAVKNIELTVSYEFISKKVGVTIPKETTESILQKLGFTIIDKDNTTFTIKVPSWRATKDVSLKEDIAEEVGRIYGYEQVPLIPLDANFRISHKNRDASLRDLTLSYFSERNWNEVYNYSFSNGTLDKKLGLIDTDLITIRNAFNEEYTHMRTTLAGRLFENLKNNLRHDSSIRFFEIGNIYAKNDQRNHGIDSLLSSIEKKPFSEKKILS